MQGSERQLGLFRDVQIRHWHRTYDLYLTDKRMILFHTRRLKDLSSASVWGFLIGGLVLISAAEYVGVAYGFAIGVPIIFAGVVIGYFADRFVTSKIEQKEKEMIGLGFNEMSRKDKKSFDIPYKDIEKIELHVVMRFDCRLDITYVYHASSASRLGLPSGQRTRLNAFSLEKEQYEQLSVTLLNIPQLKEKLVQRAIVSSSWKDISF